MPAGSLRVLVTGAGGQLGLDLVAACTAAGDDVFAFDRGSLDVCSRAAVHNAVTTIAPDVVFNCAAWTAVDDCESDPDRALATNGTAVRWLAEATHRVGGHLVQVSTDFVFDGTLDRPYHEWDDADPKSVYGISKLVGEQEALVLGPAATVARTSWVCGANGDNMVKTIMRLAAQHSQLSFVADRIGHPTFTHDLAPALRRVGLDRLSGVVHVTTHGACSWYQFAAAVVAAMGKDPSMVQPIAAADLLPARPAPRPANSVLDNAVLRIGNYPLMRDYHAPLTETVAALLAR